MLRNIFVKDFRHCCLHCGLRFRDHFDLLSGLRECWHGMTDTDYHSWKKPITLVITAPSGSLLVEWNALKKSVHTLLAAFCISMLILPVWVLIGRSMGPTRASESSFGSDELLLHKAGEVMPFGKVDELHCHLYVLSHYSRQSLLILVPSLKLLWVILWTTSKW